MKDFDIKVNRTTMLWIASTANVLLILELLVGIEWQALTIFIPTGTRNVPSVHLGKPLPKAFLIPFHSPLMTPDPEPIASLGHFLISASNPRSFHELSRLACVARVMPNAAC